MAFQADPEAIVWRLHLRSSPETVYGVLDSNEGRAGFWAETARERDGSVEFVFVNGLRISGRILERDRPRRWAVEYFGSVATFDLHPDQQGGTDLTLTNTGVAPADRTEVTAGWLNVLLPLKAFVDHGIDLRSHDPTRTWNDGYVDQ